LSESEIAAGIRLLREQVADYPPFSSRFRRSRTSAISWSRARIISSTRSDHSVRRANRLCASLDQAAVAPETGIKAFKAPVHPCFQAPFRFLDLRMQASGGVHDQRH